MEQLNIHQADEIEIDGEQRALDELKALTLPAAPSGEENEKKPLFFAPYRGKIKLFLN